MQRTPLVDDCPPPPVSLPFRSLSERIRDLEAELDRVPDARFQQRIYDQLYLLHFGKPSRAKPSLKTNEIFGRLASWCARNEVDFATFIAANMTLLKPRLKRYGFQPNMLRGENAERRYNGYLARANRRYRCGSHSVFAGTETWVGRIRADLVETESEIADVFVRANLGGEPTTWEQAVACCEHTAVWVEFAKKRGAWTTLVSFYGSDRPVEEQKLAQLRAAWSVAQGLQHGLPDRIGFTEFTWSGFLDLMRQVLPEPKTRSAVDLGEVDVTVWGGNERFR